jgi:hypothetical protein
VGVIAGRLGLSRSSAFDCTQRVEIPTVAPALRRYAPKVDSASANHVSVALVDLATTGWINLYVDRLELPGQVDGDRRCRVLARPMPGICTTCLVISGRGATSGMTASSSNHLLKRIHITRPRPRTGFSVAVAGPSTSGAAARRSASGARRSIGTTTAGSAWPQSRNRAKRTSRSGT